MNSIRNGCNVICGNAIGFFCAGVVARSLPTVVQCVTPHVAGAAGVAMGISSTAIAGAGSLLLVPAAYRFGAYMYDGGARDAAFVVQQAYRARQMNCLANPTTSIVRFGISETISQDAAFHALPQEENLLEDEDAEYQQVELFNDYSANQK